MHQKGDNPGLSERPKIRVFGTKRLKEEVSKVEVAERYAETLGDVPKGANSDEQRASRCATTMNGREGVPVGETAPTLTARAAAQRRCVSVLDAIFRSPAPDLRTLGIVKPVSQLSSRTLARQKT